MGWGNKEEPQFARGLDFGTQGRKANAGFRDKSLGCNYAVTHSPQKNPPGGDTI